jgi:hypothetical protein
MANFPSLSTGAVTQYPAALVIGQSAQVIRFLDGSDQRFLTQRRQYRRWQIRLDLLNENELQEVELFFDAQSGNYSTFSFPDPFTGSTVPNCRIGDSALVTAYTGVNAGSTSLWVIETNG